MAYRLFVDSANGVSLDPEWDYDDSAKKIENRHRTRTGAEYVYKWAEFRTIKFGLMFVSSATQAIVNSWWSSNTDLLFMREGDIDITSCRIMNNSKPISKKVKPYDDQWRGAIELGTY